MLCTYIHIYISPLLGVGGGPVGQPPLALNEKGLYLPKPHPSNRIMRRCYGISSGRLRESALRRPLTGRP